MEAGSTFSSGIESDNQGDLWYVTNYILLKDYYDRTISRIAARCVRQGNIAMEEYAHYGYILDVLEEISETGDYIIEHHDLYPYVEKKIAGGVKALEKSLNEFKTELKNNASPDMIKQDKDELDKIKDALGAVDKSVDPTVGAGMSMDDVVEKLLNKQNQESAETSEQPNRQESVAAPQQGQQQRPAQAGNVPPKAAQNQGQPQRQGGGQAPHPQGQGKQQGSQQQPKPQGQGNPQQARPQGQQQRPAQPGNVPPRAPQNQGQPQRQQGGQPPRAQGQGQPQGSQQQPKPQGQGNPQQARPQGQQQPRPQGQPQPNNPASAAPSNKGSN